MRRLAWMMAMMRPSRGVSGRLLGLAAASWLWPAAGLAPSLAQDQLPLPRFASLDSSEVNLRAGPGKDYPILWVYQRKGLPVEIIQEFDTWRRIRDRDGTVGWVQQNLLSGKRGALVIDEARTLRTDPTGGAKAVAILQPGVVARDRRMRHRQLVPHGRQRLPRLAPPRRFLGHLSGRGVRGGLRREERHHRHTLPRHPGLEPGSILQPHVRRIMDPDSSPG